MKRQLATAPEWRLLEDIQPLFAGDLPWRLVDAQQTDNLHVDATRITIKKVEDLFRYEIRSVPINLPDHDIPTHAFDSCISGLDSLLQFLETLVLDEVIASAEALTIPTDHNKMDEHGLPQESTSKTNDRYWLWRWLVSLPTDPQPVSEPPWSPTTMKNSNDTPPSKSRYTKLEALRTISANSHSQCGPMVNSCRGFLKLEHPLKEFNIGVQAAVRLNKRLKGLNKLPVRASFQTTAAQTISKTRWESGVPWDMLERLFRFLVERSCKQHQARLRLNGFQLDECSRGSLPINMFVSSCSTQTYWQDCQCVSISSELTMLAENKRDALSDICRYIAASVTSQPARLLDLEFDDEDLLFFPNRDYSSIHVGDSRMVSFEELLDNGLLQEPGGVFDMNDKVVLALSLARCLLHLVQGPWVQEQWTRENIQFLGHIDDVRDVYHPYITCSVTEHGPFQRMAPADIVSFLFSFAKLLVELETGERVPSDPLDETFEDTIHLIKEERMERFGFDDYYQAVEGCFRVNGALRRAIKEGSHSEKDPRHMVRKMIYENVVSCLERTFSQTSRRVRDSISRDLNQGKRVTRSGSHFRTSVDRSQTHVDVLNCDTSISKLFVGTDTANAVIVQVAAEGCASEDDGSKGIDEGLDTDQKEALLAREMRERACSSMFFDGEASNAQDSTTLFATRFFDSFDAFRRRYIVPNPQGGRPRVRIAVLDTGINEDDLRSRLDHAKAIRKEKKALKKDRYPIKAIKSFTGDSKDLGRDTCGHGTHVASILLRLAPDADLYIAKVSEGTQFDNGAGISEAIGWATDDCQVDIINMSFGAKLRDPDIAQAIARAKERKPNGVILFAAASNFGKNESRTYPASDTNVIGVHALDGHGNDSGWTNPSPTGQHDNFGTLGLGIKVMWDGRMLYKSGSSFACPTAAAIAANVIDWLYRMWQRRYLTDAQYNFLRQSEGIRRIFELQGVKSGDLLSVSPGTLFKQHEGEKDPDSIVCGVLKNNLPSFRPEKETGTW